MSSDSIYLGNPNLKKANTPIEFTEEQVIEFLKCKEDPVYFASMKIDLTLQNFQDKLVSLLLSFLTCFIISYLMTM